MAVQFISHVEENDQGGWFITLTDTLGEESERCNDLHEYKTKIEDMGALYGNDIEVVWTKSKTLSLESYRDLESKMAELQKEYADEINKIQNENEDTTGFNPNV